MQIPSRQPILRSAREVRPTRRELVERGAVALAAGNVYSLLDSLAAPVARAAAPRRPRPEQYVLAGLRVQLELHPARDGQQPRRRLVNRARRTLEATGFDAFIRATHRQNFLVPPCARRSFPLAELLARSGRA
jgi:hypothetical protein